MKAERDFIVQALRTAGAKGTIHGSLKGLANCSDIHVCGVIRVEERFARSSSKRRFADQQGLRKQRNRLFDRVTVMHVVIGDSKEELVEEILEKFLKNVAKGFPVDGNWVTAEIGDAEWVEKDDSILKSRIAVEFDVVLHGGVYADHDIIAARAGEIVPEAAEMEE